MSLAVTLPYMTLDPARAELLVIAGERVKAATEARAAVIEERDRLIAQAYAEGGGVREIARAVGLSHPVVLDIIAKSRT